VWVVAVVLLALGVAAGVVAANNKEGKPSTVVNQQTSTVNSFGVNVEAPATQATPTITAPTQTVTGPTKTVTAPTQTVTTTTTHVKTGTTP
jgi:hypothetical protein